MTDESEGPKDESEGPKGERDDTKGAPAPARPPPPRRPSAMQRLERWSRARAAWIDEAYCRMDPRTAGIYRIVAGFLAAAHAIRHWQEAQVYYSNDGVLTNHYHLFKPSSGHNFSIFHAFSTLAEVHVAFALTTLAHVLMMVGYRAKLFTILSFILVTSLDNRLVMVENGGYVVVNLVLFYGMFFPVGERYSVDAWLRSYRERRERTADDLNDRSSFAPSRAMYRSLGPFIAILNFATVYFLNVVNKSGVMWRRGETVHYVMHLNRMVTGVAVLIREIVPYWLTRPITWWVLIHEALLVTFILAPRGRRVTRPIAIAGVFLLHFTFGVMMRLGPFSWFMIGWSVMLIAPEQWASLEAWHQRGARRLVVVLDGSRLSIAIGRLLARLDGMELLIFEEARDEGAPLLAVLDADNLAIRYEGRDAARAIARALPGGRVTAPLLTPLFATLLDFLSRRSAGVTRFFGLDRDRPAPVVAEPSPFGLRARFWYGRAREAVVLYFAICFVIQAIDENKNVPVKYKIKKPSFVEASLSYPRLYQGWGMFAPNPITDDGVLAIDAYTIDGRRVDPLRGKEPDLDLTDSKGEGLTQIQQDYANRIRLDRNRVFRQGLVEYVRRWHLLTGNPGDEIVAFDAYWVRCDCPKPGLNKPTGNRLFALVSYRRPGYKPPPGHPPIPPEPKVESAETHMMAPLKP